jgi:hypothetical protein
MTSNANKPQDTTNGEAGNVPVPHPGATDSAAQDAPGAPSVNTESEAKLAQLIANAEAREQAAAEAEAKAKAAEDKVNAALKQIDDKLAVLNRAAPATGPTDQEKADFVTMQLEQAHGDDTYSVYDDDHNETKVPVMSDIQDYTPAVTLANITQKSGVIVFEKGVNYRVPKFIIDDLRRREIEHLDYKENLHIRHEDILPSGTISGGGK